MSLSLHLECQKLSYDKENLAVVESITLKRIQCELSVGSWLASVRRDMNVRGIFFFFLFHSSQIQQLQHK